MALRWKGLEEVEVAVEPEAAFGEVGVGAGVGEEEDALGDVDVSVLLEEALEGLEDLWLDVVRPEDGGQAAPIADGDGGVLGVDVAVRPDRLDRDGEGFVGESYLAEIGGVLDAGFAVSLARDSERAVDGVRQLREPLPLGSEIEAFRPFRPLWMVGCGEHG